MKSSIFRLFFGYVRTESGLFGPFRTDSGLFRGCFRLNLVNCFDADPGLGAAPHKSAPEWAKEEMKEKGKFRWFERLEDRAAKLVAMTNDEQVKSLCAAEKSQ